MTRHLLLLSAFLTTSLFAFDHTHAAWDKWLKKYVAVNGAATTVDYKAAKAAPEALKSYTDSVQEVTAQQYKTFQDKEKMAFIINAYNAFTVQLIVDNYPVKSIKDVGGIFTSPWKKRFFKFLGEEQHLDFLEHSMLRKDWQEPRIHFAVNCASKGCPALRNEAFTAAKLDTQLEAGAKSFLGDASRNRYDGAKDTLWLSKIFDWYGEDFVKKAGSVQAFVSTRISGDAAKMAKANVEFNAYDWNLNETLPRGNASN